MSAAGFPQGKINWPFAIAASVALHAAIIGAIFAAGGERKTAAPDRETAAPPTAEEKIEVPEFPVPGETASAGRTEPESAPAPSPSPETAPTTPRTQQPATTARQTTTSAPESRQTGPAPQRRESEIYTVRAGDSLTKIARRHNCTVAEIAAINGIKPDKMLSIGDTIKIPATEREEKTR